MTGKGGRCVVIGIGNPDRGDDAAGRAVVRRLAGVVPAGVEIVELDGEAASLLACFDGAESAFLVDASLSGARAGSIRRFDAGAAALLHDAFAMSTHGLGLAEALELAKVLGQLPPRCVVYAIEAESFETGAPLSPAVAAAVAEVADRVRNEICAAVARGGRIDA